MFLIRREWRNYVRRYAAARKSLDVFAATVERSAWRHPQDVKDTFRTPSIIGRGSDRVMFNIKGNDFRLIVRIDYARQIVDVRWFGTHAEYDRIDVSNV
jgi:mRNA interferase HigB